MIINNNHVWCYMKSFKQSLIELKENKCERHIKCGVKSILKYHRQINRKKY